MGLLSFIIAPIKDIISGLEKPVELVEKVFGIVVELIKETIQLIEKMIDDIISLFNYHKIEAIFLYPFKEAALVAVGSVEKMMTLLREFLPNPDNFKDDIYNAIDDAYQEILSTTKRLKNTGIKVLDELRDASYGEFETVKHRFESIGSTLDEFPQEINLMIIKVKDIFEIEKGKLFHVVPEFTNNLKSREIAASQKIKNIMTKDVSSFKDVEDSLKTRLANENSQIDFLMIFIFIGIIGLIGAVYYFTRSGVAVFSLILIFFICFIIYMAQSVLTSD